MGNARAILVSSAPIPHAQGGFVPFLPAARPQLDVGPADVGRRLTMRYRVGDGLNRSESELVGVLYRWSGGLTDGILRLRRRDGIEVGVRADDIISARVVRPELSAYAMQRLCQQGWPPLTEQALGPWVLRASRGATGRANSVRVAGVPKGSLRTALTNVRQWYDEHGLPPRLQVPLPCGIESELGDLGWTGHRTSRVMVAPVGKLLSATSEAHEREDLDLSVEPNPNPDFLQLTAGCTSRTAPEFEHTFAAVRPAAFVYCRNVEGQLLGIGHATLQDTWCGATTIQTLRQSRRRGIATAVTAAMAQWAQEQGATNWYLQLFEDNAAALGFYERLGFVTHHRYEYRWPGDIPEDVVWPSDDTGGATGID